MVEREQQVEEDDLERVTAVLDKEQIAALLRHAEVLEKEREERGLAAQQRDARRLRVYAVQTLLRRAKHARRVVERAAMCDVVEPGGGKPLAGQAFVVGPFDLGLHIAPPDVDESTGRPSTANQSSRPQLVTPTRTLLVSAAVARRAARTSGGAKGASQYTCKSRSEAVSASCEATEPPREMAMTPGSRPTAATACVTGAALEPKATKFSIASLTHT